MTDAPATGAGELTRRWLVAIVGVPVVLGALYLGGWFLGIPLAAVAWIGADETYRLVGERRARPFGRLGGTVAVALVVEAVFYPTWSAFAPWALGTLGGLGLVSAVLAMARRWPEGAPLRAISVTLFGALYAGLPIAAIPLLHAAPAEHGWDPVSGSAWSGLAVVALPLAATWIGDSAAFFAGIKWGRSKILPAISPKKSWVGSWAGLAGSGAAGGAWFVVTAPYLPGGPVPSVAVAVAIGAVLGVGAQAGDFVESMLKREAGVKDSGKVFPGHGGMLDRLDALIVTIPLAYALLLLLERAA